MRISKSRLDGFLAPSTYSKGLPMLIAPPKEI
jgi:hypothetical protein